MKGNFREFCMSMHICLMNRAARCRFCVRREHLFKRTFVPYPRSTPVSKTHFTSAVSNQPSGLFLPEAVAQLTKEIRTLKSTIEKCKCTVSTTTSHSSHRETKPDAGGRDLFVLAGSEAGRSLMSCQMLLKPCDFRGIL